MFHRAKFILQSAPKSPRAAALRPSVSARIVALGLAALTASSAMTGCAMVDEEYDNSGRRPWVGEGGRVLGVSGSYSYREDDDEEREYFAARGTIEEFLTDEHAVGAYVLGQFSNEEDDDDGREQLWAGLHYHYHYHLSQRTSIYGGPSLGYALFDDETANDGALTYGISTGIRHWLTERAAVTLEPTFLRANFDSDAGGNSDEFIVLWGLAFSL